MHFILIALIISAVNGDPISYTRVGRYSDPQACLDAQAAQSPIQQVKDAAVTVYGCVREDQLGETSS
jgi:hypothetical protein